MRADPLIVARAVMRAGRSIDSFVYFVRAGDAIKIGTTRTIGGRLGSIQTGNAHDVVLLAVIPGTHAEEHAIHRRFADDLIRGEWFRASPALLEFITEAAA